MNESVRTVWRLGVLVVGIAVLVAGIALLVLPGPGILLIVAGLAILGAEFAWARGWLRRLRRWISDRARERRDAGR